MKRIFIFAGALVAFSGAAHALPFGSNSGRKSSSNTTVETPVVTPKVHAHAQVNGPRNISRAPFRNSNVHVQSNTQFRARHFDLQRARVENQEKATFRQNRAIANAERWQGPKYAAFRNYHAQWHDRGWWRSHHNRIVFLYGAPYYWDEGWWYPAWGYDPYASYYYDGPIYAYNDLPPDQVIANVQASLQEQGYYEGEIDGVLGPLTRAAIAAYQQDHGLYVTSAIDEPTLASLGMV